MRCARVHVHGREHYAVVEGQQVRLLRRSPFGRWQATDKAHLQTAPRGTRKASASVSV
ncbi:MAG: DUF2437 domain-containing protein [Chloroflexota bacterium]|nr:DUF2437 domain-containing protein [Chloroflexota bacterium]